MTWKDTLALGLTRLAAGRSSGTTAPRVPDQPNRFRGHAKYLSLHEYLDRRYADSVMLSFGQIEDLLGFALPAPARHEQDWWANPNAATEPSAQSHSWNDAGRTARPNFQAGNVLFERRRA